jgi:hypothetical protein
LVYVDGGAKAVRGEGGGEDGGVGPEFVGGIGDFDRSVRLERGGELEIEIVGDAEVALFEGGVEDATFEAEGADGDGFVIGFDGELGGGRKMKFAFFVDEVPVVDWGREGVFGGDETQFQEIGREDGELGVTGLGEGEGVFEG